MKASPERGSFLADVVLGSLPFLVVLVFVPVSIYLPNQIEFDYNLQPLLYMLGLGILAVAGLVAFYALFPHWRGAAAKSLLFLGLFLLISDIAAPLDWALLDGDDRLREPMRSTVVQVAIAVVLSVAWATVPTRVIRAFATPLVLTVTAFQLLPLVRTVWARQALTATDALEEGRPSSTGPAKAKTDLPNVYHIVFDGYSSLKFLAAAAEYSAWPRTSRASRFFPRPWRTTRRPTHRCRAS